MSEKIYGTPAQAMSAIPVEPVTVGGWYKTADGRWVLAEWGPGGRLRISAPVDRPTTSLEDAEQAAADEREQQALREVSR